MKSELTWSALTFKVKYLSEALYQVIISNVRNVNFPLRDPDLLFTVGILIIIKNNPRKIRVITMILV